MKTLAIVGPETTRRRLVVEAAREALHGVGEVWAGERHEEVPEGAVILCVNYRRVIRPLRGPTYVMHDSLLPKYAGSAPLAWQILNEETEGGVTLFRATERVDDGPILEAIEMYLGDGKGFLTYDKAYDRLTGVYCELTELWARELVEMAPPGAPTKASSDNYCLPRRPSDSYVRPADMVSGEAVTLVRASSRRFGFPPVLCWESARRTTPGRQMILTAQWAGSFYGRPGQVVKESSTEATVLCKDGQAVRFVFDPRKDEEVPKP